MEDIVLSFMVRILNWRKRAKMRHRKREIRKEAWLHCLAREGQRRRRRSRSRDWITATVKRKRRRRKYHTGGPGLEVTNPRRTTKKILGAREVGISKRVLSSISPAWSWFSKVMTIFPTLSLRLSNK